MPGCSWLPPLDIYQNSEQVTVRLEAPGLKKEDFDLSLKDDTLTISGGRQADNDSAEAEDGRAARSVARFSRSVTLPSVVKADGVTAGYEDGVLTVTLPKAEEAKPRKIEVSIK